MGEPWSKYADQEKIRRFREAHGLDTASLSADTVSIVTGADTACERIAAKYAEGANLVAEPAEP